MNYSALPKVDKLILHLQQEQQFCGSRELLARAAREAVAQLRADFAGLPEQDREQLFQRALLLTRERCRELAQPSLMRVINATGVALHTNLGRAPLSECAIAAVTTTARHYSNLELDLDSGKRSSRYEHVAELLRELTGAEDALVVNNNAAAVFLTVNTLAEGGQVVISRGQLVEIGGSFRVPDILTKSGAELVEVGATNRTNLRDYAAAITEQTRLLLTVHPSNFRMEGYVSTVGHRELAELAHSHDLPLVDDLGSGCLAPLAEQGVGREPTVSQVVNDNVDVVTFSGDKLLGGPQAGIIVGKQRYIEAIKANPLNRALRVDKMTLAALEATLLLYRSGQAEQHLPALRMILADPEQLRAKALRLAEQLHDCDGGARLSSGLSEVGGGSLPLVELPTTLVTLKPQTISADELLRRLRQSRPALLAYIHEGKVVLDPRTMTDEDINTAAQLIRAALS